MSLYQPSLEFSKLKERVGGSTQGSELVPAIHMYKSRVEHCHEMIKPNEPLTYKLE